MGMISEYDKQRDIAAEGQRAALHHNPIPDAHSDDLLRITTANGKYTVVQTGRGNSYALRLGEEWPAYPQDKGSVGNLALALAYELQAAREEIETLKATIHALVTK